MKKIIDDIKSSTNTKILISILVFSILIFLKTCSLKNHTLDLQGIKNKNDSLTNVIKMDIGSLEKRLDLIQLSQVDLISYTLHKDDLRNKEKVISDLKRKIILLKENENKQ